MGFLTVSATILIEQMAATRDRVYRSTLSVLTDGLL